MKTVKPFLVLSLTAIACLTACNNQTKENTAIIATETIAVKTQKIQQAEGANKVTCTGILTTENEATYAFKVGGVIDRITVSEGQSFKKGSLLATLKIVEIEAGYMQTKLGLEKAERDLLRITNLYHDSVATLEQFQNTKTAYDVAKKQVESAAFNKQYAYIYAANDGFVTKKLANEGEVISGGSPVLFINETNNQQWILKVGLSDKDWAIVETGNAVKVVFDAYPHKVFNGSVFRKSLASDSGTGSFQIEIKVNCQNINPAIGMFGKATIETTSIQKFHSIPYDALVEADGKNAFVFVPMPQGKVKKQAIEIASFDNNEVKVKSGLESIKEVVLTNSAFLNESSTITIIQ